MARTADDIVRAEVHVCLSSLVSTLAKGYGTVDGSRGVAAHRDLSDLTEQAAELAAPIPDYESAAREAGWLVKGKTWFNERFDGPEAAAADDADTYESTQELCDGEQIEPHDREVYEHWAISDWLAEKLEAKGEKIDRDFAGLIVWARTTTGQLIAADWVIEQIAADLAREYPE